MPLTFTLGLDLGQLRDHSALAVVERPVPAAEGARAHATLILRHLERFPLGTPYSAVASRVASLTHSPTLAGHSQLLVDATGVGLPVVEMLRAAQPAASLTPVLITSGHSPRFDAGVWRIPKLDLLSRLQSLFESETLRIPRTLPESGSLFRELLDIRSTRTPSGSLLLGAGSSSHDDLALALALAVWPTHRPPAGPQPRRLF